MKIWIKLLLGTAIGVALGIFLPETVRNESLFAYLSQLVISIGRYAIFPLVFFSAVIGTYELRKEEILFKTYSKIFFSLILTTALLTVIGTLSVLVIAPTRIPIIIQEQKGFSLPSFKDVLLQIFPRNLFSIFTYGENVLLPLFFFSILLGLNFTFDRMVVKPAVLFFDSMSRIIYHLNSLLVEIISFGILVISAYFFMQIRATQELSLYKQLIITLGIDSAVVLFGIYPLLLYTLGNKENPYKWLYGIAGPAIVGFISRDSYFSLAFLLKHGKENLGIPRKAGSASFPLFAMFGRAGTAMVTSVSFIIILKSYSSLGIGIPQLLWVMGFTFLISFILSSVPGLGVLVALSLLSEMHGVKEGYLILQPIAPLLISFGVLLDVASSAFASFIISVRASMHKPVEIGDFI